MSYLDHLPKDDDCLGESESPFKCMFYSPVLQIKQAKPLQF